MSAVRQLTWFLAGFASATALVAVLEARPASAQERPLPSGVTLPPAASAVSRGRPGEPIVDEADAAPDLAPAIPSDDPARDPNEEQDDLEPRPRSGQRAVVRDGDLSADSSQPLLRDGIIDIGEPEAPVDGIDPTAIDTRTPEEFAPFELPPNEPDPLLFQIESTDPLSDRRPRRLATLEPYDPIGIKVGSFVLFPEVELGFNSTSNVLRSPLPRSDLSFDVRPSARLVSNWAVHALEFRTAGTLAWFSEFDSENEQGYLIEARGRLDVTRRTNVQGVVSREVTQESRSAIDASTVGDRTDVTTDRAALTVQHRFNRLSLQMRGTVTDLSFGDVNALGVTQLNDDRNITTTEEAIRATWELKPALSVFAEVAVNQREYERATRSDGIKRDSAGERWRLGLDFGSSSRILRGEISLGYGTQRPDDPRLADVEGILIDSNLAWRITALTSLLFTARSEVSETSTTGSGGVLTRQAGVEARHAIRRQLIGSAGLAYTDQDYAGVDIDENEWRGTIGLEYFLAREAVLFGRYVHTRLESTEPQGSYTSDEIRLGVRLRR